MLSLFYFSCFIVLPLCCHTPERGLERPGAGWRLLSGDQLGLLQTEARPEPPVLVAPLPPQPGTRRDGWPPSKPLQLLSHPHPCYMAQQRLLSYQRLLPGSPACGSYTHAELFVSTPTALQISQVSMRYRKIQFGSFLDYLRNTGLNVGIIQNRV